DRAVRHDPPGNNDVHAEGTRANAAAALRQAGLTVLNVDNLSLAFGGLTVLDGVSFDIAAPEILSVIGPNGAGKTSLFNTISGLYRATAGSVSVQGRETTALPAH